MAITYLPIMGKAKKYAANAVFSIWQRSVFLLVMLFCMASANAVGGITIPPEDANLEFKGDSVSLIKEGTGITDEGYIEYGVYSSDSTLLAPYSRKAKAVDAGEYIVAYRYVVNGVASLGENGLPTIICHITPAPLKCTGYSVTAIDGLQYDGSKKQLVDTTEVACGKLKFSVEYESRDGKEKSTSESIMGTNAGTYKVTYWVEQDKNHEISEKETVEVVIKPDTCKLVGVPETTRIAGSFNSFQKNLVRDGDNPVYVETDCGGTVKYKIEGEEEFVDGDNPLLKRQKAGVYKVYCMTEGTNDYVGTIDSFYAQIIGKTPSVLEINDWPKAYEEREYTGEPVELLEYDPDKIGDGWFKYEINDSGILLEAGDVKAINATEGGNPIKIRCEYVCNNENYDCSKIAERERVIYVHIKKAECGVGLTEVVKAEGLVYNGKEQVLIDTINTKSGCGKIWYKLSENGVNYDLPVDTPKAVGAGEYSIQYWVEMDGNHKGDVEGTFTATIGKKKCELKTGMLLNTGLVYDNSLSQQKLLAEGATSDEGNVEYSIDSINWEANFQDITATDAGTYKVYYRIIPTDEDNYEETTGYEEVTIAPIGITNNNVVAPEINTDLTYSGEECALLKTEATSGDPSVTFQYRIANYNKDNEWHDFGSMPKPIDAGIYEVYYRINGGNANEQGSVQVTIAPLEIGVTITPTEGMKYSVDDKYQIIGNIKFTGILSRDLYTSNKIDTTLIITSQHDGDTKSYTNINPVWQMADKLNVVCKLTDRKGNYSFAEARCAATIDSAETPGKDQYVSIKSVPLTYNGELQPLFGNLSTIGDRNIRWFDSESGTYKDTTEKPMGRDAGDYEINFEVTDPDGNYKRFTLTETITISKAKIDWGEGNAPSGVVSEYKGEPIALIDTSKMVAGCDTLYYGMKGQEAKKWKKPTGKDAEDYDVYYVVKGCKNHLDKDQANDTTWLKSVIKPVMIDTTGITRPVGKSLTYNGSEWELTTEGSTKNGNGTIWYSSDGVNNWQTEPLKATVAGTYTVYFKVVPDASDKNHYETEPELVEAKGITIGKAGYGTVKVEANEEATYNEGNDVELVVNSSDLKEGCELKFRVEGSDKWVDVPTAKDAGDYLVHCKVEGDENHNGLLEDMYGPIVATVMPKPVTITEKCEANTGLVYDGNEHELNTRGDTVHGRFAYSLESVAAIADRDTAVLKRTDAREYTVYYKYVYAKNYTGDDIEGSFTVTIGKADAVIDPAPKAISGLVYAEENGEAKAFELIGTEGVKSNFGVVEYSTDGTSWTSSVPTLNKADSLWVYFRVADDDNYNGVEDKVWAKVSKADAVINPVPEAVTDNVYEEEAGKTWVLVTEGESNFGKVEYRIGANGTWSESVPTIDHADSLWVYYRVEGTTNYNGTKIGSVWAGVAKAKAFVKDECEPTAMSDLVYDGGEQKLLDTTKVATVGGAVVGGKMMYKIKESDGTYSESEVVPSRKEAAEGYEVCYYVKGGDNYADSEEKCIEVGIAKGKNEIEDTLVAKTGLEFDGSKKELVDASGYKCKFGEGIEYKVGDNEYRSDTVPMGKDAGVYTVIYRAKGSENYEPSDTKTLKIAIGKAKGDTTRPVFNDLVYDDSKEAQGLVATCGAASNGKWWYRMKDGEWKNCEDLTVEKVDTYTIEYQMKATDNNYESYLDFASVEVIIKPCDMSEITKPEAKGNLVVSENGDAMELTTAGSVKGGWYEYAFEKDIAKADGWSKDVLKGDTAGEYVVYYRIMNDENHNPYANNIESDSLHIRINSRMKYDVPTVVEGLVYNGEKKPLVNAGEIEGGKMYFKLVALDGEAVEGEWKDTLPKGVYPGRYTVAYKIVADEPYVGGVDSTVLADIVIAKGLGNDIPHVAPEALDSVGYTGTPNKLFAKVGTLSEEGGKFMYGVMKDGEIVWKEDINDGELMRTDAGADTVYYKIVGCKYYEDMDSVRLGVAKVGKADITDYEEPEFYLGLFDGDVHKLIISKGRWNGGEIVFYDANGKEKEADWNPKEKNASVYKFWYKVYGDKNHNDMQMRKDSAVIEPVPCSITQPPYALNLSYTGEKLALADTGIIKNAKYVFAYTENADADEWKNTLKEIDAIDTVIYYRAIADPNAICDHKGSLEVSIKKAATTAILTVPSGYDTLVYNGEEQELFVEGDKIDGRFVYSEDGEEWTSEVIRKTDAGRYKIWYKFECDANHYRNDEISGSFEVVIRSGAPKVDVVPVGNSLVYTGEEQGLIVAGKAEKGILKYSLDGEEWSTDLPKMVFAKDSIKVYYKLEPENDFDDELIDSVMAFIDKAKAEIHDNEKPTGYDTLLYNEKMQDLVKAGEKAKDGEMLYYLENSWTILEMARAKNASEGYVVHYFVKGDEYHYDSDVDSLVVKIGKVNSNVKENPKARKLQYNGNGQSLCERGDADGGVLVYWLEGFEDTPIQGSPQGDSAGTYIVYFKVKGDVNHYDTEKDSIEVTIEKADMVYVTAPRGNMELAYKGESSELLAVKGKVAYGKIEYSVNCDTCWTEKEPTALNAGTYTIWYRATGDANHNGIEPRTTEAKIDSARASILLIPQAPKDSLFEDGNLKILVEDGIAIGGKFEYSVDGAMMKDLPVAIKAGTYRVEYRFVPNPNYNDNDVTGRTGAIDVIIYEPKPVIVPEEPVVIVPPVAATELTYTGDSLPLVTAPDVENGKVLYSMDGETWSEETPKAVNADSMYVYYKVVGNEETGEEKIDTIKVGIAKAKIKEENLTTRPSVDTTLRYDGDPKELFAELPSKDSCTIYYGVVGEEKADTVPPTLTDAGEYEIYYIVKGDANHEDSDTIKVKVTIDKAETEIVKIEEAEAKPTEPIVYAGDSASFSAKDFGWEANEEIEYIYGYKVFIESMGEETVIWSKEWPRITEAGAHTVYYKVKGKDSNYSDSKEDSITVTIEKATLDIDSLAKPEAEWGLVCDSTEKDLVKPLDVYGGWYEYRLSDTEVWSKDIPSAKSGANTVYYKFVPDKNHKLPNDTVIVDSFTVVIDDNVFDKETLSIVQDKDAYVDVYDSVKVFVLDLSEKVRIDSAVVVKRESEDAQYDNRLAGLKVTQREDYKLEIAVPSSLSNTLNSGSIIAVLELYIGENTIRDTIDLYVYAPTYRLVGLWGDVVALDMDGEGTSDVKFFETATVTWYMDGKLVDNVKTPYLYVNGGYAGHEFYCQIGDFRVGPLKFPGNEDLCLHARVDGKVIYLRVDNAKKKEAVRITNAKGGELQSVMVGADDVPHNVSGLGVYVVYMEIEKDGKMERQSLKVLVK